jgi:threonine synthase
VVTKGQTTREMTKTMDHVLGLRCVLCGAEYGVDEVLYVCPNHGDEGILDVAYDYSRIGRQFTRKALAGNPERSIWRYRPLLPVLPDSRVPPLTVGWTPLYSVKRLRELWGLPHLWVKDDGRQPTASFKDRASAVGIVKALEMGRNVVCAASTGNAASSLAGLSASMGLRNVIFVPETAPEAKVAQLLVFGATVVLVRGTYDQAFDLSLEATRSYGWYNRSTAYNPYLSEGKKTAALEVCEQLDWDPPDRIFVSVGDGCIIGGLGKGIRDLKALGLIDRTPKLMGVQAAGSKVLYEAWKSQGEEIVPVEPTTLADSISVGVPRDRIKALRAVRETGGEFVVVSDEEILEAMRVLGRTAGVFAEPAGAASLAGLHRMLRENRVDPEEGIVVLVTGNGLKDVNSAIRAVEAPQRIEPTVDDLRRLVDRLGIEAVTD